MSDAKGKTLPDPETFPEGAEPIPCWATVVKDKSEDGMFKVESQYLNSRICVNLRSTTFAALFNKEAKKYHSREIIYKVYEPDHWIPTELLDIELDQ